MPTPPLLAALVVTGLFAAGAPAALPGGTYIDDAAGALANTSVYVSGEVDDPAQLAAELGAQVGDASIAVAVFSDNAGIEASANAMVGALADRLDGKYETIIVAVGDDVAAGSNALPKGEALRIANEAEKSSDSVEDALVTTVQQISAEAAPAPAPSGGVDAGLLVGLALAVAVLVGAGVALAAGLRRRGRRAARGSLPDGVKEQVAVLRGLVGEYAAVGASGNHIAAQTSQQIAALAENVPELFARLDRRDVVDQAGIAAVEYDDKLRKLTAAVGRDYLLDILTHPQLWDDPDERVREVVQALESVSEELLANIKQVNARSGLHFQVSLDGLIGKRKELQDWDRAFGEASDGSSPTA